MNIRTDKITNFIFVKVFALSLVKGTQNAFVGEI